MVKEGEKIRKLIIRRRRVRLKLSKVPRLSVFVSNRYIWAQIIDDSKNATLVAASSKGLKKQGVKIDIAREVGRTIAKNALKKKIARVGFDRGSYKYHGRIKALAEGAREVGLKF